MKRVEEYTIAYKGLKDGKHSFAYHIDSTFFALFEASLYNQGNVKVNVELVKGNQMLVLDFKISGEVESSCDNCLEPVNVAVNCDSKLFVKFGEEYDEPSDDLVVLPHGESEFNLERVIHDLIVTSLPIRHLHSPDSNGQLVCNPEMLNKLKEYLVENVSTRARDEEAAIDPRWSELKKIIDKN